MDTTTKKRPLTMAELLPLLEGSGLLSDEAKRAITSTATKKPRPTIATIQSSEKVLQKFKPMTMAEMLTGLRTLQPKSPKMNAQIKASTNKKWNSSTKMVYKTVSHTANQQMKHNPVRKVLNFQPPKPKVVKSLANSRTIMMNPKPPKLPKPEIKAKIPLYPQARNTVRISGICNIPHTPVIINKTVNSRKTIANKENFNNAAGNKKPVTTPKSTLRKKVLASRIPDTPLSNESWKSSCDASFLQNEQDIEYIENKVKVLTDEQTLDNIGEVSPPVSTPFTEYRNVGDYFNNTDNLMENTYTDNTIVSLDNTVSKENDKREESVIVLLSEMLNKVTVSSDKQRELNLEIDDLLEVQKQTETNIQMIENGIRTLMNIKEAQLKTLTYVKKRIHNKTEKETLNSNKNITLNERTPKNVKKITKVSTMISNSCSVINISPKQPAYKIPKKTPSMNKKLIYQSMPNIPRTMSPQKSLGDRALSMYLQMKERNNYLTTPLVKRRPSMVPNTPTLTSHNLQQQLDRLYGNS